MTVSTDQTAALLAPWLTRQSLGPRKLVAPGPAPHELALLLKAAQTAPDHGRLRPCRLEALNAAARHALGEAFRAYRLRTQGALSGTDAAIEMERALAAPCLIVANVRLQTDNDVPVHEQWLSAGAVIGNLMSAANALGYSGKVLSGRRAAAPEVRQAVCQGDEIVAGFIYLGTDRLASR